MQLKSLPRTIIFFTTAIGADLRAQDAIAPGERAEFEVASIKRNVEGNTPTFARLPGGRLHVANNSLRNLILLAYEFSPYQLFNAPDWSSTEHYDIEAKANGNPTPKEVMGMLQKLLEDRFKLRVHQEIREQSVYTLSIAKGGLKLQPFKEGTCVDRSAGNPGPGSVLPFCGASVVSQGQWNASKIDMKSVARMLSSMLSRTVNDKTGLTGLFDVHLELPPGSLDSPDVSGQSIFAVLQEQWGLRLESDKGPSEVLVVDHVERPSEN